tara:strand:- start:1603 stop:2508 length:906 start_codon:yes stop_codon:yes gene_type:complete
MGFRHLRLLDYALKNGISYPNNWEYGKDMWETIVRESITGALSQAVCIDISDPMNHSHPAYDMCLSPPFQHYWLEVMDDEPTGKGGACLVTSFDADPKLRLKDQPSLVGEFTQKLEEGGVSLDRKGLRWGLQMAFFFCDTSQERVFGPTMFTQMIIDALGTPLQNAEGKNFIFPRFPCGQSGREEEVINDVCYAHTLLNCKNVRLEPRKAPRQVRRQMLRDYGYQAVTYRRLTIDPSSLPQQRPLTGAWENRLHLVRGHMRDFRRKGLFGKYYGMFYCPPHLKGNPMKGEVIKDYEVKETV